MCGKCLRATQRQGFESIVRARIFNFVMWPPLSHFQGKVTGLLGLGAFNFVMWPLLRQVRRQGSGSSKRRNTQFCDVATFESFLRQG